LPGTQLFDEAIKKGKINKVEAYLQKIERQLTTSMAINLSQLSDEKLLSLKEKCKSKLFDGRVILKE